MENIGELRDRPIFICGHPKAGTSLVRALLDSHPQLVVYPEETVFFRRFLPQAEGLEPPAKVTLAEHELIHIFTWNKVRPPESQEGYPDRDYSEISFDDVRQTMGKLLATNYRHNGDILSAAVLAYGAASRQLDLKTRYWVEKSPYNEYFTAQIYEWWPEARCIHVVRDPHDNYVSYRRKHPNWATEFFANNWKRSTRSGLESRKHYGSERYWLLRYEDLVQEPMETIKAMLDFINIEWHESLTEPTRAGEGWAGNSMFAERFRRISAAPVGRWKEQLAVEEAAVIDFICSQLIRELEYQRAPMRLPFSSFVKAQWRARTWPLRKSFYHRLRGAEGKTSPA